MRNRCRLAVVATHPIHYQIQLFKRLAQAGVDVTVLFCSRFGLDRQVDPTFDSEVQWYTDSVLDGLKHRFLKNYSWEPAPRSLFGTINPGVVRELRRNRYDVLLVNGYMGLTEWVALITAKLGSCKLLFRAETVRKTNSSAMRIALRRRVIQALDKLVDVFLPIGTRSREFYLMHGIPAARLVLSPYAVDNEFFMLEAARSSKNKREIRQALGLPADRPVILYVSKLVVRKRPLDLLSAFERLPVAAALVFVGDGPLRSAIETRVAERRIRNVFCLGFQNQASLPQFYALGDVFVLPSGFEPWGLVINEAMCFSLPVITTREVASAADLVAHGENGFVYDAGDCSALSEALQVLVGDRARREEMGRRSFESIQEWNLDVSAEGIRRAISMVMGE